MTLSDIRDIVMQQIGNDLEDYEEYDPALTAYINDGYDKLLFAYNKTRVGDEDSPALTEDTDVPVIPEYAHLRIADYATYMVYRNGNPGKQQRGAPYFQQFREAQSSLNMQSGTEVVFTNLYD